MDPARREVEKMSLVLVKSVLLMDEQANQKLFVFMVKCLVNNMSNNADKPTQSHGNLYVYEVDNSYKFIYDLTRWNFYDFC